MKQLVKSPVNFTSGHCREEEESPRKKKKKIQRGNKFKTQNGQGGGGDKYDGDTADYREGSLGLTFFQNDVRAFFETAERSRLWDMTPTKNRSPTSQQYGRDLYRCLGRRPIGVFRNATPGVQMGMRGNRERVADVRVVVIVSTSSYKKAVPMMSIS